MCSGDEPRKVRSSEALKEDPKLLQACHEALKEDPKLGKALLRTAHVHLMMGDATRARKYYAEASAAGAVREAEAGLKSCINEEQQQVPSS